MVRNLQHVAGERAAPARDQLGLGGGLDVARQQDGAPGIVQVQHQRAIVVAPRRCRARMPHGDAHAVDRPGRARRRAHERHRRAREDVAQRREALAASGIAVPPQGARGEGLGEEGEAAEVVEVGVRERQPVDASDAAPPQVRCDDARPDVEVPAEAAAIDHQHASGRELDHGTVPLADGEEGQAQLARRATCQRPGPGVDQQRDGAGEQRTPPPGSRRQQPRGQQGVEEEQFEPGGGHHAGAGDGQGGEPGGEVIGDPDRRADGGEQRRRGGRPQRHRGRAEQPQADGRPAEQRHHQRVGQRRDHRHLVEMPGHQRRSGERGAQADRLRDDQPSHPGPARIAQPQQPRLRPGVPRRDQPRRAEHDAEHRGEGELKADLVGDAGPQHRQPERRRRQRRQPVAWPAEQQRGGAEHAHHLGANGGDVAAGERAIEQHRPQAAGHRQQRHPPGQQQALAARQQPAQGGIRAARHQRDVQPGDRQHVADPGARKALAHRGVEAAALADQQRRGDRRALGRHRRGERPPGGVTPRVEPSLPSGQRRGGALPVAIVGGERRERDSAARQIRFVVELARVAEVARLAQRQHGDQPVAALPGLRGVAQGDAEAPAALFPPRAAPRRGDGEHQARRVDARLRPLDHRRLHPGSSARQVAQIVDRHRPSRRVGLPVTEQRCAAQPGQREPSACPPPGEQEHARRGAGEHARRPSRPRARQRLPGEQADGHPVDRRARACGRARHGCADSLSST